MEIEFKAFLWGSRVVFGESEITIINSQGTKPDIAKYADICEVNCFSGNIVQLKTVESGKRFFGAAMYPSINVLTYSKSNRMAMMNELIKRLPNVPIHQRVFDYAKGKSPWF